MNQEQDIQDESMYITLFGQVISPKDEIYEKEIPNDKDKNFKQNTLRYGFDEINKSNNENDDISPLVGAMIQEEVQEYIDNNPQLHRMIRDIKESKMKKNPPVGEYKSEKISMGQIYVYKNDNLEELCVVSNFNFEENLSNKVDEF